MKLEERIQFECVMWLQEAGYYFMSVPNEATAKRASHFIAMGMRPGASDLVIIMPAGRVIFVELKNEIGTQKKGQKLFQSRVEELGHTYILIRSLDELKKALSGL